MAIYTTFVEQGDRPNLRNYPELWALVDDMDGHIIAYCLRAKDAEYLKALLVYYGDKLGQAMKAQQEPEQ